mmetsp:Transcript_79244/g.256520  ORF Transcript_79244/g.256520 Transcript_79244/m.256520 type:complete len:287 (+) Transcript_79244:730-1590(+)
MTSWRRRSRGRVLMSRRAGRTCCRPPAARRRRRRRPSRTRRSPSRSSSPASRRARPRAGPATSAATTTPIAARSATGAATQGAGGSLQRSGQDSARLAGWATPSRAVSWTRSGSRWMASSSSCPCKLPALWCSCWSRRRRRTRPATSELGPSPSRGSSGTAQTRPTACASTTSRLVRGLLHGPGPNAADALARNRLRNAGLRRTAAGPWSGRRRRAGGAAGGAAAVGAAHHRRRGWRRSSSARSATSTARTPRCHRLWASRGSDAHIGPVLVLQWNLLTLVRQLLC